MGTGSQPLRQVYLSNLADDLGRHLGCTPWEVMSQDRIDRFAVASGDTHWIHTDPDRARMETRLGKTLVHGTFTISQISARLHEVMEVPDAVSWMNYGYDRIRFPSPIVAEAQIRYGFVLEAAVPKRSGILLRFAATVEIKNEAKPGMLATFLTLVVPRA